MNESKASNATRDDAGQSTGVPERGDQGKGTENERAGE